MNNRAHNYCNCALSATKAFIKIDKKTGKYKQCGVYKIVFRFVKKFSFHTCLYFPVFLPILMKAFVAAISFHSNKYCQLCFFGVLCF